MKNKINIFFQKVIVDNLETNIKYLLIIFLIFGVYFKSEYIYIGLILNGIFLFIIDVVDYIRDEKNENK